MTEEVFTEINLISDTVTRPSAAMKAYMMEAIVGDDVFKEDPTVIALEEKLASMFGHEAALFCPTGTMTNQIAIKTHTEPLDELICDKNSHVFLYEVAGYGFHSGLAIQTVDSPNGKLNPDLIKENIKPSFDWLANSKLVVLENTGNRTGGICYSLQEMQDIAACCRNNQLRLHLDGARIFNAIVEEGYSSFEVGSCFDSISICLSKGLGAPIGSVLTGNKKFIAKARKIRKVFGGGMRQAGIIAAAGIYAIENHINDLKKDHLHADQIKKSLQKSKYIKSIKDGNTNIIIFDVIDELNPQVFLEKLLQKNIRATAFGQQTIRFVTHRDISQNQIKIVCDTIENIE